MSYLQSLSVFWAVVDEGSFSAAAKRLDLTQPTISFHIDNLEKRFGCPLFTRTAKGVAPTIYGRSLYESTIEIEAIAAKSEHQLSALASGASGHIKLGASTIPAQYILPQIIGKFLITHPANSVSLTSGDSSTVLRHFEAGELPIAVIGFCPNPPLHAIPIFEDELVLVAHPDYIQLGIDDALTPNDLTRFPLIVREPSSGSRKTVADALRSKGVPWNTLQIAVEAGGNEACCELIQKKVGIGFLSRWAAARELRNGRLRRIQLNGIDTRRTFYALSAKSLLPTAVEAFWQFLLSSKVTEE